MLHDVPVKSQNPIRNALRRRGAKSVAFAPVQYFEYTPPSDDEGSGGEEPENGVSEEPDEVEQPAEEEDEITVVEPLQTSRSIAKASLETPGMSICTAFALPINLLIIFLFKKPEITGCIKTLPAP